MKKVVHIGYPKNFSTSLQRNFFSLHPDVFHLGIGLEDNLGYFDDVVDTIFELYLKTSKNFLFEREFPRLKVHIEKLIQQAENSSKKVLSVSSEHLSFSFTFDSIDFNEKLNRLKALFGEDLSFIMIIRNQFEVFKSLYRESVRVGYIGSFAEYIYSVYKYQDRSYYFDFSYDLVFKAIEKEFGKDSCSVFLFEDYRNEKSKSMIMSESKVKLINDLCDSMGVEYLEVDFEHYNEALTDSEIRMKSQLNKNARHDLGEQLYGAAEKHRLKKYLINDLKLVEAESILYEDVIKKRSLIAEAKSAMSNSEKVKLDYYCSPEISEKMKIYFEAANHNFQELSGIQLPPSYFNLNF